jgi:hypothetical protein
VAETSDVIGEPEQARVMREQVAEPLETGEWGETLSDIRSVARPSRPKAPSREHVSSPWGKVLRLIHSQTRTGSALEE